MKNILHFYPINAFRSKSYRIKFLVFLIKTLNASIIGILLCIDSIRFPKRMGCDAELTTSSTRLLLLKLSRSTTQLI